MISRQQVTDIITTALKGSYNELATNHAQEFAANLATALDALGLIQFCDITEPNQLGPLNAVGPDLELRDRSKDRT